MDTVLNIKKEVPLYCKCKKIEYKERKTLQNSAEMQKKMQRTAEIKKKSSKLAKAEKNRFSII